MTHGPALTALVAVKDARHPHQVQGHAEFGVGLDVQRLLTRQPSGEARRGVLPACQADIGYVEQLWRVGRWWQGIREANACNEVLVDWPALAVS